MIVTDQRVANFVAQQVDTFIYPPWTGMGIERDGEIVAGVVFNCFTGSNVEITVAGHGWTRRFMREVGRYVFGSLGCERMTITTEHNAVAMLGLRLGGQIEGTMRNFYGEARDGTIIGVLKREYRF